MVVSGWNRALPRIQVFCAWDICIKDEQRVYLFFFFHSWTYARTVNEAVRRGSSPRGRVDCVLAIRDAQTIAIACNLSTRSPMCDKHRPVEAGANICILNTPPLILFGVKDIDQYGNLTFRSTIVRLVYCILCVVYAEHCSIEAHQEEHEIGPYCKNIPLQIRPHRSLRAL